MNLDYKILWFEDRDEWYDEAKKTVGNIVDEHGFNFPEPIRYTNSIGWDSHNLRDFDLILVDFKLDNETGDSIIEKIRANDVYTEIIFYSTDGDVQIRKTIADKGIDGVFCASRDGGAFERKVTKVIETTLKKVQDINNMRGLIMATTSDLDESMLEIIETFIKIGNENSVSVSTYIFEIADKFISEKNAAYSELKKNNDSIGLANDTLLFDSYKRARVVQKIVKMLSKENLSHLANFLEVYNKEIIQHRNAFAHVSPKIDENGNKILVPKRGDIIIFTDELCKEIREKLSVHNTNLNLISGHLK
jgi:CheY-like chemotaxis protein